MFDKGTKVVAKDDHFDEHYGDIYIESGDEFEVIDNIGSQLTLRPLEERKYIGESEIKSHPDFFRELVP